MSAHSMKLIALIIAGLGGMLVWYGGGGFENTQVPHSMPSKWDAKYEAVEI